MASRSSARKAVAFAILLAAVFRELPARGAEATDPAAASDAETGIPFAAHGGIRDWRVEDDATLLLQDIHGNWYRARLAAPAWDLAYAQSLGFTTAPSGTLERLDSIVVRGRAYPILSLKRTAPPAAASRKPPPQAPVPATEPH